MLSETPTAPPPPGSTPWSTWAGFAATGQLSGPLKEVKFQIWWRSDNGKCSDRQTYERTNERTACIWVFCAKFMQFWRFNSHGNIFFEFSIHFYAYIILMHNSVQRIYFKKNKILCWKWLKMLHFSLKPPFWGIRISLRPLTTSYFLIVNIKTFHLNLVRSR